MKRSALLSISTVVPDTCVTSDAYLNFVSELLQLTDEHKAVVNRFVTRSEIERRYTVMPDFAASRSEWKFFGATTSALLPSTQQRNDVYKKEAPVLAWRAAEKLLMQWGGERSALTHIIFVSCTGLVAPGIEFYLVNKLGLSQATQRIALNFMGCFGAFRALALADAIALQNPSHRILIVCTELCSLHIQNDMQIDTIIGNALFADGATAMLVGCQPRQGEKAWWEIVKCASYAIENSPEAMRWDIGDSGFVMRLSNEIPHYLRLKIKAFVENLISNNCEFNALGWAIHPGGKAIINAIEQACNLDHMQTASTWHVLQHFGNMSSVSIPFVLQHLYQHQQSEWTVAVGFGPGLSVEGVLLKHVE